MVRLTCLHGHQTGPQCVNNELYACKIPCRCVVFDFKPFLCWIYGQSNVCTLRGNTLLLHLNWALILYPAENVFKACKTALYPFKKSIFIFDIKIMYLTGVILLNELMKAIKYEASRAFYRDLFLKLHFDFSNHLKRIGY